MYNTLKKEFSEDPIEVIKAITFLGTAIVLLFWELQIGG
mgnify:CR=1 FL=1